MLLGYEISLEPVIRGLLVPVLALLSGGSRGTIQESFSLYDRDEPGLSGEEQHTDQPSDR